MDVLSDVLKHLRLECSVLSTPRAFAPWAISFEPRDEAVFHLVAGGSACLTLGGRRKALELSAGTFVLLPHGSGHVLADAPGSVPVPAEPPTGEGMPGDSAGARIGGDGRETLFISGTFRYARHGVHPLLSQLPELIHVQACEGWRGVYLEHGVHLLSAEAASDLPGAQTAVTRLMEVLFVQALRSHTDNPQANEASWLQALRDKRIAQALGCIHGQPAENWTTARLAEQVGMSRAAFAAQFAGLVGEPPPLYLTRWRVQSALAQLRDSAIDLSALAQSLGFPSAAAFGRIFKRMVGMPPMEYRRALAEGHEPPPQPAVLARARASA